MAEPSERARRAAEEFDSYITGMGHWTLSLPEQVRLQDMIQSAMDDARQASDARLCQAEAMLEAVQMAVTGKEPSDFMLSFPVVRATWDLMAERDAQASRVECGVQWPAPCADTLIPCRYHANLMLADRNRRVRELEDLHKKHCGLEYCPYLEQQARKEAP